MNARWSTRLCPTVGALLFPVALAAGCADFDTTRRVPPRGTVGRELYTLVCDRVGANALREDVTGASYHALCHPDARGAYGEKVDTSKLVPLDPRAADGAGRVVPLEEQARRRAYHVARIERLAKRREDLVRAFDAAFPEEPLAVKALSARDPARSCDPAGDSTLPRELGAVLGRLKEIENDGTVPGVSRGIARVLDDVRGAEKATAALARLDARRGYRPLPNALGALRPLLGYPRLPELSDALLRLLAEDGDPLGPSARKTAGPGNAALQSLLAVLHEELRTAEPSRTAGPLTLTPDARIPGRTLASRPRTSLEVARALLLHEDPAFDVGETGRRLLVRRDPRGVASVALANGAVPAPFVDLTGPQGGPDGLPDLDPLGRFVLQGNATVAPPFSSPGSVDSPRDPDGRALRGSGAPLYAYVDTGRTYAASLERAAAPLLDPDPAREALLKILGGAPVLFGVRDVEAASRRTYSAGPGDPPVALPYRAFHPETSPLLDLLYAAGQLLAQPATIDLLQLGQKLANEHPALLARLVGVGLRIKDIANQHPEASLPRASTLWDELTDVLMRIAREPRMLESLILAFAQPETVALQGTLAAYADSRDVLTYDRSNLNGPAFNLTVNAVAPLRTPVDRTKPDTGDNRSALQRFLQVLHDANGLAACTKDGAVAHVQWNGLAIDYPPQDLSQELVLDPVCLGFTGKKAPRRLAACGILRFDNVALLIVDVALGRAKFDVRDDCLRKMMESPLTGVVGGVDAFLEEISGVRGFSTHPTVNGIARMVYFDTGHDGLTGDTGNAKTHRFFTDVLDPVPTTVCPVTPFVDPTDGRVLPLRRCAGFADTMRARDPNALFPLEQNDFVRNVTPLAQAFVDKPGMFVDLFDVLHRHWGSDQQPKEVCDRAAPKNDARFCAGDGVVRYEPLLAEVLRTTDLFATLREAVTTLGSMPILHCEAADARTGACLRTTTRTGVEVLAEGVRVLLDPARHAGLVDRRGVATATRNDGTTNPQLSPLDLFTSSLRGVDDAFAAWAQAHPEDADRQARWRSGRGQIVDRILGVTGTGSAARFADPGVPVILGALLEALQTQLLAHCPDRTTAACPWARERLASSLSEVVSGPTFAGAIDLLEAIRKDTPARVELQRLLQYLAAGEDGTRVSTLASTADVLQVLSDDENLVPLYRALAGGLAPTVRDAGEARRSFIGAVVESLARVFARARDADGHQICGREIDPNHAIAAALRHLSAPMDDGSPAPLEVLMDVIADVNRADPSSEAKLEPADYANIGAEVSDFCLNKGSGLEQVYQVIREATFER